MKHTLQQGFPIYSYMTLILLVNNNSLHIGTRSESCDRSWC